MNGSNGMNGSMSTNGATAKGDAMDTVPAATPKFTDSPEQAAVIQAPSYEDVVVVAGAGSGKTYTMTAASSPSSTRASVPRRFWA